MITATSTAMHLVEAARLTLAEHVAQDRRGQELGERLDRIGDPVGDDTGRHRRQVVGVLGPPFDAGRRLGERRATRHPTLPDRPEVVLNEIGGRRDGEITGDGQHRVARCVIPLEEVGRVLDGGRLDVDEAPVPVVGVVERLEHNARQDHPREAAVRPVEDVDLDLLFDHVDLVAQRCVVEPRTAHAAGLDEQSQLQRVRRQLLDVGGEVRMG
jgi:hypothetical protein